MVLRRSGLVLGVAVAGLGCAKIAGLEGDYEMTGAGGQGARSGATYGAGAGSCTSVADCAGGSSGCMTPACQNGSCVLENAAPGTVVSIGQPGDCKATVCDASGNQVTADADSDVPDDGLACTIDACNAGIPTHSSAPAGTPCTDSGGKLCDGSGACVACLANGDCTGDSVCQAHLCVAPTCVDGVKDGTESDIDCGGGCAPCGPGKTCTQNTDCAGGLCDGGTSTCAATCTDGVKNQNETDIDCGGSCGATCKLGQACTSAGDCASGYCAGGICQSACIDGKKDFGETDIDCGGPCPDCALGKACANPSDCQSSNCVDAVCCDTACAGVCQACSAAKKGGGTDGTCGPIAAGTDPDNECATQAVSTCSTDGSCNGAGACRKYAAGTVCVPSACVNATTMSKPDLCDGNGTCVDGGTASCGAYACAGSACNTSCKGDADCAPQNYCASGQCAPQKALGGTCSATHECLSGYCVDGVCCESSCTAKCMACSVAKKAQGTDGKCEPIKAGTDPDNECPTDAVSTCGNTGMCDGAGACAKYAAGTVCASASCSGSTFQPAATCNGSGKCVNATSVSCTPYDCAASGCLTACMSNADCAAGYTCVVPTCQ